MYFLIGLEAGDIFLKRGFNSWPWGTPLTLFFMYCGSQVSIEMKNWEIWKELAKLSDEHTNWFFKNIIKNCVDFFPFLNVNYFQNIRFFLQHFLRMMIHSENKQCSHNTQVICICYSIFPKSKNTFLFMYLQHLAISKI